MNVFVKPDDQSQTCLRFGMARKGQMKSNVFVKPDDQSQTCLRFGMARKGRMKSNVFVKSNDQSQTSLRFGMARKSRKKGNCFSHVTMLCILAFVTTLSALASSPPNDVWQSHARNVDEALKRFVSAIDEYGMQVNGVSVIQHGKSIANWWGKDVEASVLLDQHELSATVTAMAVGLAENEGLLSLDDKVAGFFPDLLPAQPSANLLAMTVRHLLTMTTGHDKDTPCSQGDDWAENYLAQPVPLTPGSYFYYDPMAGYMLSAIVQKVTGQSLPEYLHTRLFEPLGIKNIEWECSPQGISAGGWGLHATTQDMARIGSLLVQNGKWEGQRILPRKWVRQMISFQTASCPRDVRYEELSQSGLNLYENDWIQGFGYQMWHCRSGLVRAEGSNGQLLLLFPEFDAVVMINAEAEQMESELAQAYLHFAPSIPDWRGRKENRGRTQTRHHYLHYVNSHL